MEVGEYIRTTEGCIVKIKNDEHLDFLKFSNAVIGDIVKHSKNIIDLIEAGDYVNGHLVLEKYQRAYDGQWQLDCGDVRFENSDIKIILTREMYAQNCYEVGEE